MIRNRPETLLADPDYGVLLPPPYQLDWSSTPELTKFSLLALGGIQPLTGDMAAAADGLLSDKPTPGEIELFRQRRTKFQLVSVVANCIVIGVADNVPVLKPYSITVLPSSKRGEVTHSDIEFVAAVSGSAALEMDSAYIGYDPFVGEWAFRGEVGLVVGDKPRPGFMDEVGLVTDYYFLATDYDENDVAMVPLDMDNEELRRRYFKHRTKLLFTPFERLQPRRVWGVESPIELFLLQELSRRGRYPQPQVMIMEDGSTFGSFYELWRDLEAHHTNGLISEVDLFFPEQKVAVFCDGAHHRRRKQREKDLAIVAALEAVGIRSVRIPGRDIMRSLVQSADRVIELL
jgi:hypothetical protein